MLGRTNSSSIGGYFPSVFFTSSSFTSSGSVTMTGQGKTYHGVWTSKIVEGVLTDGFLIEKVDELGTYEYTATQGEKTKTVTLVIDAAKEYNINIEYILYLYNAGDECTSATGGWAISYNLYAGGYNGLSKQSTYLKGTDTSYDSYGNGAFSTRNKIDLTTYSKIYAIIDTSGISGYEGSYGGGSLQHSNNFYEGSYNSSSAFVRTSIVSYSYKDGAKTNYLLTGDISNISGEKYICMYIACYGWPQQLGTTHVKQIWIQ